MTKIIEKIRERSRQLQLNRQSDDSQKNSTSNDTNNALPNPPYGWYYSFEFFPPKTEAGMDNLLTRVDRMTHRLDPLFINVTFSKGAANSTLSIASHAQKYLGVDVLLHLTVQGMSIAELERVLEQAKASGIHNILALRGDPPRGKRSWKVGDVSGGDCDRAIDLVKLVRTKYGNYFGIAVAGHPEGHPSSSSISDEMQHLKEKVDAGADFIISQFFYDTDRFIDFVQQCRSFGIDCPILPGILPIQSYSTFKRMTDYCKVAVPDDVWQRLDPVKDNDQAVKDIGCEIAADMCRRILNEADVQGVHFYTLNLERSVTRILITLGAIDLIRQVHGSIDEDKEAAVDESNHLETFRANTRRSLPWRKSSMHGRSEMEEIRPINWANRPRSYVMRTELWDEFPNGRWGDATSPAFGELSDLSHFHSFSLGGEEDQRAMLGHYPKEPKDVYEVFASYVEGKFPYLPWCETPLQAESFLIQPKLAQLNRAGFLTINSQPAVNAAPSTHKIFGWGGRGGYVYQKAYCECFCSPENTKRLVQMVKRRESMHLYAVNNLGEEIREGHELGGVTALTWGVFPNREILQPTIFDPSTFLVWAEEAFSIWTSMWLNLYDFDTDPYELIETIRDTYFLVAIIDNDYVSGAENNGQESAIWKAMLEAAED